MSGLGDITQLLPYAPLVARMGLVALFVVTVAVLAERLGPFMGAMVASLPLYTGPVYVLLALEHDTTYLAAASIGSLAICGATPVFALAYCLMARTHGAITSIATALAAWAACAVIVQTNQWSMIEALLFVTPIYIASVVLARGFTRGIAVRRAARSWLDLPLRAVLVALVAGCVITISQYVPPQLTGVLSVFPIIMSSLAVVLHGRIGGPATAALFAHTLGGLVGMVLAFVVVHLTIERLGAAVSLAAGLAVTIAWNLTLVLVQRLTRGPAKTPVAPPPPRAPSPPPPARRAPHGSPSPRTARAR